MGGMSRLDNLSTESRIVYSYFITNEYANKVLHLLLEYLNTEYDFYDAIKQLAKEISDVIDGFTHEIMQEFDPLVQALMMAAIDKIEYTSIAEALIEGYMEQV